MDEMQLIGSLFVAIFEAWNTPITLPFIGDTSFFKLTLVFAALTWLGYLVRTLIAGDDKE